MLQEPITSPGERLGLIKDIVRVVSVRLKLGLRNRLKASDEALLRRQYARRLIDCFELTEGVISFDEAVLLYELANKVTEGCIVEVGSNRGRSTVALGRGSLDGAKVPVYALDPRDEPEGVAGQRAGSRDRAAIYRAMLETSCYKVVQLIGLKSALVAPNWSKPIGMLFVDGDRSYDSVRQDFNYWAPFLLRNSKVAFAGSSDANSGPAKLIAELLQTRYSQLHRVGDISVLVNSDPD